jgi:hypothetical protein
LDLNDNILSIKQKVLIKIVWNNFDHEDLETDRLFAPSLKLVEGLRLKVAPKNLEPSTF